MRGGEAEQERRGPGRGDGDGHGEEAGDERRAGGHRRKGTSGGDECVGGRCQRGVRPGHRGESRQQGATRAQEDGLSCEGGWCRGGCRAARRRRNESGREGAGASRTIFSGSIRHRLCGLQMCLLLRSTAAHSTRTVSRNRLLLSLLANRLLPSSGRHVHANGSPFCARPSPCVIPLHKTGHPRPLLATPHGLARPSLALAAFPQAHNSTSHPHDLHTVCAASSSPAFDMISATSRNVLPVGVGPHAKLARYSTDCHSDCAIQPYLRPHALVCRTSWRDWRAQECHIPLPNVRFVCCITPQCPTCQAFPKFSKMESNSLLNDTVFLVFAFLFFLSNDTVFST